jgi:DNA repair exonuclease SbcCD nuclease subunit
MTEFAKHVKSIGIPYWYVLGNHDQYKPKDSKYHALQSFSIENLKVFDTTENIDDITIVPYVQDTTSFPTDTNRICITHNTFTGADYGFKLENFGIDSDKVSADIIISGHIHKKQTFGKVIYTGTPIAHNASDVDEIKSLLLLETSTLKQTWIDSPFPMWKSLDVTLSNVLNIDGVNAYISNKTDNKNKWIVKIHGPKDEINSYIKSEKYEKTSKDRNLIVKIIDTDNNKRPKIAINATSPLDIISEYVDKIYDGGIDKQLIIRKAQDIMKKI